MKIISSPLLSVATVLPVSAGVEYSFRLPIFGTIVSPSL